MTSKLTGTVSLQLSPARSASVTEPTQYLPFINARRNMNPLDPMDRVECCSCVNTFPIAKGVAFEAINNGEVLVGLWCGYECYLKAVPLPCCGRC